MNIDKSYLTAIGRKSLPVPSRWLLKQGSIVGPLLDYGCGKCHEINTKLLSDFEYVGYDPHYRPWPDTPGKFAPCKFNTILCNYVLCVIPEFYQRLIILKDIQDALTPEGIAYISVRMSKPKQGWGWNSRGTYQGKLTHFPSRPLYKTSSFIIYLLTKNMRLV